MSVQIGRKKNTTWQDRQMRALSSQLIVHEQLVIPLARAKELRKHVDHLITLAKGGTLHQRRQAAAYLRRVQVDEEHDVLQKLFDNLGKKYAKRKGGYTRVLHFGNRRGDNAPMAIIALV